MTGDDWQLVGFSVRMAVCSTLLILPFGLALAWLLARRQWPGKILVETVVALPLVLPPVVTGLFLLQMFGLHGPLGHWLHAQFGIDVVFTWKAVVLALGAMSFPLLVLFARAAIEDVNPALEQIARTLGAGEWRVFATITLPLAKRGILAGILLSFARALGEFGATIMVAGNIPGRTTTLPVAIYSSVLNGDNTHAWILAGISTAIAFVALWLGERIRRRRK
jgi:molybdate transport system permease protein